ncbi:peptide-methionine (S)-S-oxide reductase MsrA [Gillisia marina]|uniref:peptide-methionine (S)-S-oxide reductase MsrA n=1 Tax=Gillisia marina TaxID=1167637 RepID=UPI0002F384E7|nr:peptide-methionine (S)-S-oxide reductase MsrA [Gillisia marina]
MEDLKVEIATLAGGCFWCTEAVFERVEGVSKVIPGFTGGQIKNPAYREIISGRTGHAETIEIHFDPNVISFKELLLIFFSTHDPTTLNRQQYDKGTQYRSAVFYHSGDQKK